MKPILIGIGYVALGLITIWGIGLLSDKGVTTGICVGTMTVMLLTASRVSYDIGNRDAKRAAERQ